MREIITLVVDLGLGALAYRIARQSLRATEALHARVSAVEGWLKENLGWSG